jgi:hypothetical protein
MNTLETLAELAFAESRRLADDPNVAAVGCGVKMTGGRPTGTLCLQYFVKEKRRAATGPTAARAGTWQVPADLDGVPTDVVEVGEVARAVSDLSPPAGARGKRVGEPLMGGYATAGLGEPAAGIGGYGTLGGICFDDTTFAPLFLSNAHVWGLVAGAEAIQPIYPSTVFSTKADPLANAAGLVRGDILPALRAAVAFANAGVWSHLITGLDNNDPVVFGQGATAVPDDARTETETASIAVAASPGMPPAGRPLTSSVSWAYQRLSTAAELDAATTADRTNDKTLRVQKASTDAATYAGTKQVKITAEVASPGDPAADPPHDHFVVAHIYPLPLGDKVVRRLLRPVAGQPLPPPDKGFQFKGEVSTADLVPKGTWAVSLFVQKFPAGITESLNVAAGSNGVALLVPDCTFTVT